MFAQNRLANAGVEILYVVLINTRVAFWYLSVNNNILQVRDQVQLHKNQFLADVFTFGRCSDKHFVIKTHSILNSARLPDKMSGLEASGTIRLHGWTNNVDARQGQADGLLNQTMVECKKKNDTKLNHAFMWDIKKRR